MLHINGIKIEYKTAGRAKKSGAESLRKLLADRAAKILRVAPTDILQIEILRESIDARKKPEILYQYAVAVEVAEEDKVYQNVSKRRGRSSRGGRSSGNRTEQGRVVVDGAEIGRADAAEYRFPHPGQKRLQHPVVIVGAGPAGLFCGYFLARHGYCPIILERGKAVEARCEDVQKFWESGVLLPDSNVQFGEGGAGTFSDGKLNTLVKDKDGRGRAALTVFVECGAGEEILYEAKPHIGTDVLCRVVKNMRENILENGGSVRFESKVTDIAVEDGRVCGVYVNGEEFLPCEQLVLAIGHSARDTFSMLYEKGIPMEAKSFAVGLRVEHSQRMINLSQYGQEEPEDLGAAPYKVTAKADNGRGVYSFCMCPGGYVVNASSEEGFLAVNGMSYSGRNGRNANSAVIVSVTPEDYGAAHPLAGVEFQRRLERTAHGLADGKIPMQRYGVFRECVEQGKSQEELGIAVDEQNGMPREDSGAAENTGISRRDSGRMENAAEKGFGKLEDASVESSGESENTTGERFSNPENMTDSGKNTGDAVVPAQKGLGAWADVSRILPSECNKAFVQGMTSFGRQIAGFDREDTVLSGVESRTSSPVRISRDETLQSAVKGLYPCGEGAGYAGGITSAAMDGMRVAEAIAAEFGYEK